MKTKKKKEEDNMTHSTWRFFGLVILAIAMVAYAAISERIAFAEDEPMDDSVLRVARFTFGPMDVFEPMHNPEAKPMEVLPTDEPTPDPTFWPTLRPADEPMEETETMPGPMHNSWLSDATPPVQLWILSAMVSPSSPEEVAEYAADGRIFFGPTPVDAYNSQVSLTSASKEYKPVKVPKALPLYRMPDMSLPNIYPFECESVYWYVYGIWEGDVGDDVSFHGEAQTSFGKLVIDYLFITTSGDDSSLISGYSLKTEDALHLTIFRLAPSPLSLPKELRTSLDEYKQCR